VPGSTVAPLGLTTGVVKPTKIYVDIHVDIHTDIPNTKDIHVDILGVRDTRVDILGVRDIYVNIFDVRDIQMDIHMDFSTWVSSWRRRPPYFARNIMAIINMAVLG